MTGLPANSDDPASRADVAPPEQPAASSPESPSIPGDEATGASRISRPERPHLLTLITSFAALILSAISALVAWRSYDTAAENLRVSQRAALVVSSSLATPFDALDRIGGGKPVKIVLSWTIRNVGNSEARVDSERTVTVQRNTENGGTITTTMLLHLVGSMDRQQEQTVPIVIPMTSIEYHKFRQEQFKIKAVGDVKYKDKLSGSHSLAWTLQLTGGGEIISTQNSAR